MRTDMPSLTADDFKHALRSTTRKRFMRGQFENGGDIAALRRFIRMTQAELAQAIGVSVHTLRNWEQDRQPPNGQAIAMLRIAARHPGILRENLAKPKAAA